MIIEEENYGVPKETYNLGGKEIFRKNKNQDLGRVTYVHEIISNFEA